MEGLKIKLRIKQFMNNEALKHKLYVIIFQANTPKGKAFDVALIGCILFSIAIVILESLTGLPPYLALLFITLEYLFTAFFTFEYLTRIYCSPSPRKYIFSFFGIIDLLATLPLYLAFFLPGSRYLLIIRAFRLIRVFRIFKLFSFLKEGQMLLRSLKQSSRKIIVFFFFVVILVTSLGTLMYMIEGAQGNSQFDNIPNSIYWSIVTMTTVGYGDITPVTALGKLLSAFVMLLGYTIIAVPTGIVSVSMMKEYKRLENIKCPNCHQAGHEEHALYCKYCGERLDKSDITPN
ncbi:ion transporter [Bacteroides sp.]|uniref:ion transporter n=1 Tax=Bacteroides sp. TaxID=29523 RepID=UPI0025C29E04|nr:ion transporter [Bacteroides sp.]